jgi:hypothetical protein
MEATPDAADVPATEAMGMLKMAHAAINLGVRRIMGQGFTAPGQ